MNTYLLIAGILVFLLGIIHSVIGEILLLRHLKNVKGFPVILKLETFARLTIRAVWHITTVFAFVIGSILLYFSNKLSLNAGDILIVKIISISMFLCFLISLLLTRGRHVSWIVFLVIGILCAVAI